MKKSLKGKMDDVGSDIRPLWSDMFTTWSIVGFVVLIAIVMVTVWVYVFGF